MLEIFTFVGVVLIVASIALYRFKNNAETVQKLGFNYGNNLIAITFAIGVFSSSVGLALGYADAGYYYLVQYPTGTQRAIMEPGPFFKFGGQVVSFKQYLTVKFENGDHAEHTETGFTGAQNIRFNDSVESAVSMTVRFQLPSDPVKFQKLAVAYRSQENLVSSTLIPTAQEAMRNSARMFSGQEYVSGKGGDFEQAIFDQIQNGVYLLDTLEKRVQVGAEHISVPDTRTIDQNQTIVVVVSPRKDVKGNFLRKETPFKEFGILVSQSNVQNVEPDQGFKDKLKAQRDISAQIALERQNAVMEDERKRKIIAQGEADKAEKRVELEKGQIDVVLKAETEAKKAEQRQKQAITEAETAEKAAAVQERTKAIELRNAKLDAEKTKTLAEAEANQRTLLMKADNALEKRLNAYIAVNKMYADALTNKQLVPSIVVGGSSGNGGNNNATDLASLMMALVARDLGVKVNEPKEVGNNQ